MADLGGGDPGKSFAKRTTPDPGKSLARLAVRLRRATGAKKSAVNETIRQAFDVYNPEQVTRLGKNAGLADKDVAVLRQYAGRIKQGKTPPVIDPVGTALDVLGRPAQVVQAVIANRGDVISPASQGSSEVQAAISGESDITPIRAALRAFGKTPRQAANTEADLPGVARFVGNLAGSIITDPTTYVTLGVPATTRAAARSAALTLAEKTGKITGEEAAALARTGALTSSEAVNPILQGILTKGLTAQQKQILKGVGGRTIFGRSRLIKDVKASTGGIRVAGQTVVPGRVFAGKAGTPGGKAILESERMLPTAVRNTERLTRTYAGARQIERAGLAPRTFTQDIRNLAANVEGALARGHRTVQEADRVMSSLDDVGRTQIRRALEDPGAVGSLSRVERAAFDRLAEMRQYFTDIQVKAGILQPDEALDQATQIVTDRYFPRFQSEETAKLAARGQPLSRSLSGNVRARDEATRFTPTEDIADRFGTPKFELDPGKAIGRRAALAERDVAGVEFTRALERTKVGDNFPLLRRPVDDAERSAWAELRTGDAVEGYIRKDLPRVGVGPDGEIIRRTEPVLIRHEISRDFDNVTRLLNREDDAVKWLKDGYDKYWLGLWKGYATTPFPLSAGFTERNFIGNLINGFWLTGANPSKMFTAMRLQRLMHKGFKEGDAFKYLSSEQKTIMHQAIDTGALDTGFFKADLGAAVERGKVAKGIQKINPLNPNNVALHAGRVVNNAVEQNARLGLFLDRIGRGYTPHEASRVVQKYLFDYSDLSIADRAIKEVVPFFTWTRKNIPLQLETLVKQPYKITSQVHGLNAARGITPPTNPAGIPFFTRENQGVPIGSKVWLPDLPITSADQTLAPIVEMFKQSKNLATGSPTDWGEAARKTLNSAGLGGPLSAPLVVAQIALGKQYFSGREFQPGETTFGLPSDLVFGLEQIGPLGPAIAKIRGLTDEKTRARRLLAAATGQSIYSITKKTETSELYRRLALLQQLQMWIKNQGGKIPESVPTSGGNPHDLGGG